MGKADATPRATVVLVSCVGAKLPHAAPARDLYQSDWFLKARAYAEAIGSRWFILSARCGVLNPARTVTPYEQTLNTMDRRARAAWAEQVQRDLAWRLEPGDRVVVLAGKRYREDLVPWLRARGIEVEVPMEGLGIGQQLAWLKAHT